MSEGLDAPFLCPLCREALGYDGLSSYVCARKHTFDRSRKGIVNFVPAQKPLAGYTHSFFESRRAFLAGGFYDKIMEAIVDAVGDCTPILDAGCGEGTFTRAIATENTVYGLDLSKEAIRVAAYGEQKVHWSVGDLSHLPFQDRSMQCVLNAFSPAAYAEFLRVLMPGGRLVKVIPGNAHFGEVRTLLAMPAHANDAVTAHCNEHFTISESVRITNTRPLSPENRALVSAMTPLLFGKPDVSLESLTQITVDAVLLIGAAR